MSKEFDNMVDKVIKAIKEIEPDIPKEEIHKKCIIYVLYKMCESEEIFTENLYILDTYAENGFTNIKKLGGKK